MLKVLALCLLAAVVRVSATNVCNGAPNACISKRAFCWNGDLYECANSNFECHGDGPCVERRLYPRLPGHWKRFQCLNNNNFANGPNVKTCAAGTQCWPQKGKLSPCIKKRHRGHCPAGNGGCVDDRTYCEGGFLYKCPAGLHCAGRPSAPLADRAVSPCAKKLT